MQDTIEEANVHSPSWIIEEGVPTSIDVHKTEAAAMVQNECARRVADFESLVAAADGNPGELAMLQKHYKEMHAEFKKVSTLFNAFHDQLRFNILPARFEALGTTKMTVEGVGTIRIDDSISVKTLDAAALEDLLDERGASDLIKPTVNASSLKAWVTKQMEDGAEIPADVIAITPVVNTVITK